MDDNKIEDKFNIMIIGDADVGKTSILESYFNNKTTEEIPLYKKSTVGNIKF
jgi:GTPase SAR1 family protein